MKNLIRAIACILIVGTAVCKASAGCPFAGNYSGSISNDGGYSGYVDFNIGENGSGTLDAGIPGIITYDGACSCANNGTFEASTLSSFDSEVWFSGELSKIGDTVSGSGELYDAEDHKADWSATGTAAAVPEASSLTSFGVLLALMAISCIALRVRVRRLHSGR
jgi:hypothetical protein